MFGELGHVTRGDVDVLEKLITVPEVVGKKYLGWESELKKRKLYLY